MNFAVTKPVPSVAIYGGEASAPIAIRRQCGMSFLICQSALNSLGIFTTQQKKDDAIEARFLASLKEPPKGFTGF